MTVLGLVRGAAETGSNAITCSLISGGIQKGVFGRSEKNERIIFFFKDEQMMDGFWE